jgi:SAM-dependent methyltransferase
VERKDVADWTPERIRRLWDWHASRAAGADDGTPFSARLGTGLVRLVAHAGRLGGRVLDYGCGPGHLLAALLDAGVAEARGCDASPESVTRANARLAGRARWGGAVVVPRPPAPWPDGSFDVVTCVETLEHLPEDLLVPVVRELARLAAPGGAVVVTTPNAEDLAARATYCPFCDAEFHPVGHLRSLVPATLRALLEGAGLAVPFCAPVSLERFQPARLPRPGDLSPRLLLKGVRWGLRAAVLRPLDALAPRPFPEGRWFGRLVRRGGPFLAAVAVRPAAPAAGEPPPAPPEG